MSLLQIDHLEIFVITAASSAQKPSQAGREKLEGPNEVALQEVLRP